MTDWFKWLASDKLFDSKQYRMEREKEQRAPYVGEPHLVYDPAGMEWRNATPKQRVGYVVAIVAALAVFAFLLFVGKVEQVRYLRATPADAYSDGTLLLITEPPGLWLSAPNETFRTLQPGCVYLFKHFANCGGDGCKTAVKWLRGIEYLHCEKP